MKKYEAICGRLKTHPKKPWMVVDNKDEVVQEKMTKDQAEALVAYLNRKKAAT